MILIDYSQVSLAAAFMCMRQKNELDENLIRHMILNSLRYHNATFKKEYGELVVAADSPYSWRKTVFPEYKVHRKTEKEKSKFDWNKFYEISNKVFEEIKNNLQFVAIKIDEAEADDIIGALSLRFYPVENHKTLIISRDRDFFQLHNDRVDQYSPIDKKFLKSNVNYLYEHIIYGDKGDGIPNVLSDSMKSIVTLRKKQFKEIMENINIKPENLFNPAILQYIGPDIQIKKRFDRNKNLICFHHIPESINLNIIQDYKEQMFVSKEKELIDIFLYLIRYNLSTLKDKVEDFKGNFDEKYI